ncbi:MAG: NBR1-Ig-like domain-containing protein [Anaerolineaceae bacterium]|jgi:hypothetical protein
MKDQNIRSKKWMISLSLILLTGFVLAGCNIPSNQTETIDDAVEKAMQTLQAQATLEAFQTEVAKPTATMPDTQTQPTQAIPGDTQVPATDTQVLPTATATQVPPTATQVPPTATPVPPTPTRIPPTPTPVPCNWVSFVSDVSIPDGTDIVAGTSFTKTWRLKNIGSCTWTTEYDIAFVKGDQLSAPKIIDLPKAVKPGESIDISIAMVAPSSSGDYTGHWMLVNQNGVRFGTGADTKGTFWVDIDVIKGSGEAYSFSSNACSAHWLSKNSDPLACPGKESDISSGYIIVKAAPIREDGGKENEPGLVTRPDGAAEGYIQGIYPSFMVQSGDKFRATIQCEGGSTKCDVYFDLSYRIGTDPVVNLGNWRELYEGNWNKIEVDLSSLAGKNVQFILTVRNGSTAEDNKALWLHPMIYRP